MFSLSLHASLFMRQTYCTCMNFVLWKKYFGHIVTYLHTHTHSQEGKVAIGFSLSFKLRISKPKCISFKIYFSIVFDEISTFRILCRKLLKLWLKKHTINSIHFATVKDLQNTENSIRSIQIITLLPCVWAYISSDRVCWKLCVTLHQPAKFI